LLRPTVPQMGCGNDYAKLHMHSQLMPLFFFPTSALPVLKYKNKFHVFFSHSPDFVAFISVFDSKFHLFVLVTLTPLCR